MKVKKWMAVMTAGVMSISMMTGCGTSDNASGQTTQAQTAAESQQESTESSRTTANTTKEDLAETSAETAPESGSSENEGAQGGRTLVVYYSASGHTENVANVIADAAGADLFELEPVEPYTSDDLNYTDDNSRVSQEHEHEEQRKVELVSTTVEDWDSYETVFIGYPIWWGIAAWPVDSFVEENDFTGKNVIPFCTSASSELGESGELLEKKAGTGNWQEGMRFRSSVSEEDVRSWISELGLEQ